jgi:hypothetical protein
LTALGKFLGVFGLLAGRELTAAKKFFGAACACAAGLWMFRLEAL